MTTPSEPEATAPSPLERLDAPVFTNPILDPHGLPQLDTDSFQPVDPRQLQLELGLFGASVALLGIGLAVVVAVATSVGWAIAALALALAVGIGGARAIIAGHRRRGWLVREHDVSIRRGIIRRKVTTVPFNRVQHAAVNTGPLDRHFGLARLEVYTAGGQQANLSLEGLPHERAQQLRELVTDRAQTTER
ncbi:MAG: PH domain-containing protein [Actinomycetia bacterium]|nr:PH domain-containing protein [Actinomycetes bacterium]MCP4085798.1 PH domain-containing protein [Actinomycetes bacterium]